MGDNGGGRAERESRTRRHDVCQMKFNHSYAVHTCLNCKDCSHTSRGSPNWSLFYILLAAGMALPLWIFLLFPPWSLPWYYVVSILAGEMLLFYVAGFLTGFVLMFRNIRPMLCPKCRKPLSPCGRYVKDDDKPNMDDGVLSIIHVGLNIGLWTALLSGRI